MTRNAGNGLKLLAAADLYCFHPQSIISSSSPSLLPTPFTTGLPVFESDVYCSAPICYSWELQSKESPWFSSFCYEERAAIFRNFLVDYYEFWKLADQFYWIFQGAEELTLKYEQRTRIIQVTNMFLVSELCNSWWRFSNHWLHGIIFVLIIIIVCSFLYLCIY